MVSRHLDKGQSLASIHRRRVPVAHSLKAPIGAIRFYPSPTVQLRLCNSMNIIIIILIFEAQIRHSASTTTGTQLSPPPISQLKVSSRTCWHRGIAAKADMEQNGISHRVMYPFIKHNTHFSQLKRISEHQGTQHNWNARDLT